jgi:hypothetical protein
MMKTERRISLAEKAGIYYTVHLDENLNIADHDIKIVKEDSVILQIY